MKTYPINEARAHRSEPVERALAGEPQRVTRYGKEAVVIEIGVESPVFPLFNQPTACAPVPATGFH
jgi:prevent-host-death family protein